MSQLKTYDRPLSLQDERLSWPFFVIDDDGVVQTEPDPEPVFAPGVWVTHQTLAGLGIIVAINDDQMSVLWSVQPNNLSAFSSIAFPLVRRVFTPNLAQQLIQVQPMTAPVGGVFYMDYTYGDQLEKRCTTGPWWSRLFWRAWRCTSGKTQSWWRSFCYWVASFSTKKSFTSDNNDVARQKLLERWTKRLPPPDCGP